jgi:hypothetical protein
MLDILVALVEEVALFPKNALDILLNQFKKKRQVYFSFFLISSLNLLLLYS